MQSKVTDEMMARYLSGKATPEEEAAVLDYLSENDERLDDFLAMSAAVEQFEKKEETKRRVRPLWPAISAAASVAILIGVGITLWHGSQSGSPVGIDPSPAYAQLDSVVETEGSVVRIDDSPCYAEQDSITAEEKEDVL